MSITRATGAKNKFKTLKKGIETENNNSVRKKTIDFSDGKISFALTIPQIIAICIFVSGIVWFVAAEWRFDVKCTEFKNEINNENNPRLNNIEKQLGNLKNQIENIKIRNPYLK
jgi:hypothetical protein